MASKYDKVEPQVEKLKRLYNCSNMQEEDLKYLNYQFERYKTRSLHIVSCAGFLLFGASAFAKKFNPSPMKYYAFISFISWSFWQF